MAERVSIGSRLALAVISPVLAFSLCEGILYLAGTQPLSLTEDPYVGFASTQPLFVASETGLGGTRMVTNPAKLTHFNLQSFPLKKERGTFRIFSMGGSTAYGHPWRDPVSFSGWLRELLPKADPSRKWEVINAGGISYASYREAMLVAELIRYQPDLFIVYSGHNEFLEERTYRSTAHIPALVRNLSAFLDHTRTYSALRRLMRPRDAAKAAGNGPGQAAAPGPSSGKTFNMAGEVDDVLAKTIGPTSYVRDDSLRQHVLEHYRASLARMADLAHSVGAEVLFLTTPGNEKDCSPFKSEPTPGLAPDQVAKLSAWKRRADSLAARPAASLPFYDSMAAVDPRDAALLYAAGKVAYAAGDFPRAKSLFQHALDEDICPLRAPTAMRSLVLETARSHSAQALDWTAVLEKQTRLRDGNDVLGEPDFVDHVHLSIDDYRLMAMAIIGKLNALGLAKTGPGWDENSAQSNPVVTEAARRVMSGMGPKELGEGLHNLAKVVNWAGKHEDAARIAERALATDSQGLEAIWSSLFVAAARERQGREAEALPHYRRAVRLDPNNPMSRRYLADALVRNDSNQAAAGEYGIILSQDPGDAEAQAGLGRALMGLGKPAEAVPYLKQALARLPDRGDIRTSLGEAELKSGDAGGAENGFRQALQRNPRDAHALVGLARIAQAKGNIPDAISLYAKALAIDPNLPEARAALAKALGGMPSSPP